MPDLITTLQANIEIMLTLIGYALAVTPAVTVILVVWYVRNADALRRYRSQSERRS